MSINKIIINEKIYYADYIWRKSEKDRTSDSKNKIFPFPVEGVPFGDKDRLLKLLDIGHQALIERNDYDNFDKPIDCHICGKKDVEKKKFIFIDRIWSDGITHYIKVHNIEPSDSFKDFIYNQLFLQLEKVFTNAIKTGDICSENEDEDSEQSNSSNSKRSLRKMEKDKKKCRKLQRMADSMILERVKINNEEYVKLKKNKILILDALMVFGGKFKKYADPYNRKIKRYSEHAGFLDFDSGNLQKIVVSGQTDRIDEADDEIFLPKGLDELYDYEYIWHSHPPTPKEGGRVNDGVLYELPSQGDILHFIDHYNDGNVIGSLVICPEGLYNVRRYLGKDKDSIQSITRYKKSIKRVNTSEIEINETIDIDENAFYKEYINIFSEIQKDAIKEYGVDFTKEEFYSEIAQDMSLKYIDRFNKVLNKYEINIDFYPRKKDGKFWYIDTVFLKFTT